MIKQLFGIKQFLFVGISISIFVIYFFVLPQKRASKKAKEIDRIENRTTDKEYCEQYALVAAKNGWFVCFNWDKCTKIYLQAGEVWKYGKTCNGQQKRYSMGLPFKNLRYVQQFIGTEKECLIQEKHKIYNYPNLPECQKRNVFLLRPPGNKIDR